MKKQDLPTIGAPLAGGFFGGIVMVSAVAFAVVWAPKAHGETTGAWLPTRAKVPGTESCSDSLTNTLALAEAGSKLGRWALDLRIGNHDDWCLPARDVLELAYRHLKPTTQETYCSFRDGDNPSSVPVGYPYREDHAQTSVAAFQAGGPEAFDPARYWSSTQYSESGAWYQYFNYGVQNNDDFKYEGRARAVRLIQLDA